MRQGETEAFGRYELLRRLAFGGMAEIFLAKLQTSEGDDGSRVVIKRILPQFGGDAAFVDMFVDEAKVAGRLVHSNIVRIHDFGEVNGVYFIAMEYVDGTDLRQLLKSGEERRRRLSFGEAAAICEGVARGLAYAHGFQDDALGHLEIVHRDISPHNILLGRQGDIKVTDFGIAKAVDRATRTATGTIKGKVAYMAPEQASGQSVDHRCDQFALGLLLWECLAGQRQFDGTSDLENLQRVVRCELRPIRKFRSDVPVELEHIVERSLACKPADRFPDTQALAEALASFRCSLAERDDVSLGALVTELVPPRAEAGNGAGAGAGAGRRTQPMEPASGADGWAGEARVAGERAVDRARTAEMALHFDASSKTRSRSGAAQTQRQGSRSDGSADSASTLDVDVATVGSRWLSSQRALAAAVVVASLLFGLGGGLAVWSSNDGAVVPLTSTPAGARILVDGRDVGLTTPTTLPAEVLAKSATIELQLEGYAPLIVHRRGEQLQSERLVASLLLLSASERAAASASTPGLSAGAAPRAAAFIDPAAVMALPSPPSSPALPSSLPSSSSSSASASAAAAAAAAALASSASPPPSPSSAVAASVGYLSLRSSTVWVEVYLGSKKLGTTPLDRVPIPAGRAVLRLVNASAGIRIELPIELDAGEEVRRSVAPR